MGDNQTAEERAARIAGVLARQGYKEFLRQSDAARAMGIHRHLLNEMRMDCQITAVLIGKQYRYPRIEVARHIALGETR